MLYRHYELGIHESRHSELCIHELGIRELGIHELGIRELGIMLPGAFFKSKINFGVYNMKYTELINIS